MGAFFFFWLGFGPFQDVDVNESWQTVSGLWQHTLPSNVKLVTRELPVVYDVVKEQVAKLRDEFKPDVNTRQQSWRMHLIISLSL